MGDTSSPLQLRLEDLEWLQALARRLVRDPHAAEDAVQDTLVTALERGVGGSESLRGWLAAVLRNALRQEWRGRARREAREVDTAPREPERSALEVVEELALHRRLAAEVHALDEPYRTAILLRFLRGRELAQIARELGVPQKTVRTRVDRGLARLRERMGRDRAAWLAFLGFARPHGPPLAAAPLGWILSMNVKLVSALVGVSLLGVYLALREPERAAVGGSSRAEASPAPASAPLDEPPLAREAIALERAPVEVGEAPQPASAAAPARSIERIRGFVRTLDGLGLAGIEVVFEPEREGSAPQSELPRTQSGPDGRFELPLPPHRGRLSVEDERWACVAAPFLAGEPPLAEPVVVVAPRCSYAGRVVQRDGTPIAGAELALTLAGAIVQTRDVGGTSVHLLVPFVETTANERGEFQIARAGFVQGAVIAASAEGFVTAELELPPVSDMGLVLVLEPASDVRMIHGLVLEATGTPAAGAMVSAGGLVVTCADDGRFALECEDWRRSGWLRALRPPALPAELALETLRPSTPADPTVLQLGPPARSIRGVVVDADGAPVPGAAVFTPDTTPFGAVVHDVSGHAVSGETTLEAYLAGVRGLGELVSHATAASDGSFALEGLLDRTYQLFALDPRRLESAGPIAVRAGEAHVRLHIAREPKARIAGRVVSRLGAPLAGVEITLGRRLAWREDAQERAARWAGFALTPPSAGWRLRESAATTDAEGRFDLGELATLGAFLGLQGDALLLRVERELDPHLDPSRLEIAVEAASRFQVVLRHPAEADAFSLEAPDGQRVILFLEVSGLTITAVQATIDGGRSGTVLLREGEYELVLLSGEREVRRAPILLEPGGLHVIEL